uniref:Uncharacterized protein n=1 Tax=Bartonella schoenbuchensis (strain DSM 13525 / NCTC 13165 / R1) TaxID=687861 RepID=E6YXP2_BARSR|nr:hypothetical protein B11C_10104 [Bartonella schoenbuchensis R1]
MRVQISLFVVVRSNDNTHWCVYKSLQNLDKVSLFRGCFVICRYFLILKAKLYHSTGVLDIYFFIF